MTTTAARTARRGGPRRPSFRSGNRSAVRTVPVPGPATRTLVARVAAIGTGALLAAALLTPVMATGLLRPAPAGAATPSPSPSPAPENGAPQLDCPGVVTQAGTTESIRVSVVDPDGDPVTLRVGTSMFGVQSSVSGHVVTYTAPTGMTGQDGVPVTAVDGSGAEDHCEIAVLVQEASPAPAPTPSPTATAPVPSPSRAAPAPTTPAPGPTSAPAPTSAAPGPDPTGTATATAAPTSPSPTTAPPTTAPPTTAGPVSSAPGQPVPTAPTAGGAGGRTASGTPGITRETPHGARETTGRPAGTAGSAVGSAGSAGPTPPTGGRTGGPGRPAGSSSAGTPDTAGGAPTPSGPARPAGSATASAWSGVVPSAVVEGSARTLETTRRLVQGIAAGSAVRSGSTTPVTGTAPSAGAASDGRAAVSSGERATGTGAAGWLFAAVGVLITTLAGLALMALPRGRRQH